MFLVPLQGGDFGNGLGAMGILGSLPLAADATGVQVRPHGACSHLPLDKPLRDVKAGKRLVTEVVLTLELAGEWRAEVVAAGWEGNGSKGELWTLRAFFL